jgi:S-DNA-T family DNA segregation ATPase FtsK/SpoIIIE
MHRLGARDVGATAVHISETTSGVAFVRIEGACAIRRVRASYPIRAKCLAAQR